MKRILAILLVSMNSYANVIGVGAQNFNSNTDGLDFVTVQSSETLHPGILSFGMFLNYGVNSLPYFESTPQGRTNFNDTLLGADLNFGLGLAKNWDAGISFPFILSQTVDSSNAYRGEFSQNGNTEIRYNTKYRLLGDDSGGVAVVGTINQNRVVNDPYAGSGAGLTYNLEIAADTTIKQVALGVNVGHRWRSPGTSLGTSPIQPLKNQLIASVAASYLIPNSDTKIISEIFSSFPSQTVDSDGQRVLQSAEWIAGVKHDLTDSLALHAGAGTELVHAVASPDWRVYAGINYTVGPLWGGEEPKLEPVTVEPVVAPQPKIEKFVIRNIEFEFNSTKMVGNYVKALSELLTHLQKTPFKNLTIEGHTDSVGGEEYNQKLSQRRAEAIRTYLINEKISAEKIEAIGRGESQPIADNANYQGRQLNRRVEFSIQR